MNASILLIGGDQFRSSLLDLIRPKQLSVEVASTSHEAMSLIQAQQPDLLLIQASQDGNLDLCSYLKSQSRLAWIYCIVLDDRPESESANRVQAVRLKATVLDMGADAYLELPGLAAASPLIEAWRSLLQIQIQAGLRQVHNARELIRANDVLSAIALLDPLTELNNRRAFEWELPRQIENARERSTPISLIILDVDFFKSVNDTYGHLAGDRALKLLAARLRHNLRFYDTPFRYGGEEFVVILSDTGSPEAVAIANRLCQTIASQPFAINETLDLTMTISAGTATLKSDDDPKGISLLRRADEGLLQAKSQGRNQVVGSA